MKSVTIRGNRWRVLDVVKHKGPELGYCTNPALDRELAIPIDGDTEDELNVIIHETLHASCFDLDESCVEETATSIAHVLWRLGWRKEF